MSLLISVETSNMFSNFISLSVRLTIRLRVNGAIPSHLFARSAKALAALRNECAYLRNVTRTHVCTYVRSRACEMRENCDDNCRTLVIAIFQSIQSMDKTRSKKKKKEPYINICLDIVSITARFERISAGFKSISIYLKICIVY